MLSLCNQVSIENTNIELAEYLIGKLVPELSPAGKDWQCKRLYVVYRKLKTRKIKKALCSEITASFYSLVNTDASNHNLILLSLPGKARSHIWYFERLQLFIQRIFICRAEADSEPLGWLKIYQPLKNLQEPHLQELQIFRYVLFSSCELQWTRSPSFWLTIAAAKVFQSILLKADWKLSCNS